MVQQGRKHIIRAALCVVVNFVGALNGLDTKFLRTLLRFQGNAVVAYQFLALDVRFFDYLLGITPCPCYSIGIVGVALADLVGKVFIALNGLI